MESTATSLTKPATTSTSDAIPVGEWIWHGYAGHFCCGRWCRFHLLTEIGGYFVSTVGAYVHPTRSGGSEATEAEWLKDNWPGADVGYGRKFETMVFQIKGHCLTSDCDCGQPQGTGDEVDFDGYNTAGEAKAGHAAMCTKWASRELQREADEKAAKEDSDGSDR